MKAHELLTSPDTWCQGSPALSREGDKIEAFDPRAVRWCALGAIQKTYRPSQWKVAMDELLRELRVSEQGLAQMTLSDKACHVMEWNDDRQNSFREVRQILLEADI